MFENPAEDLRQTELRRKIFADTVLLNIGSVVAQVTAIIQRLLIMRFIVPEAYGIWVGATVLLGYTAYVHFGLEHGMGVRLPYYLGRGEPEKIEALAQTTFTLWTGAAAVSALGIGLYAMVIDEPMLRWSLVAVAVLTILEQQVLFFGRWHSSITQNFALITRLSVLRSVVTFAFVVPLTYAYGMYGVLAGTVAATVVVAVMWHRSSAFQPRFVVSRPGFRELLMLGFPILLVVMLGGVINTIDRALVGLLLGATALGYYGVTTLGGASVYAALAQAGSAISPHIAVDFGRSGDAATSLTRFLVRPTVLFATLAAISVIGLVFVIPPLVAGFLPQYTPGINAFIAYIPGFYFLALIITANNIVNVILIARRQQRIFVYLQCIALAAEVAFAVVAIRVGWGIVGVAVASTVAYAFYGMSTLFLAAWFVLRRPAEIVKLFVSVLAPLGWVVGSAAVIFLATRDLELNLFWLASLRGVLYAIAVSPLLVKSARDMAAVSELRGWLDRLKFPGTAGKGGRKA